MVYNTPLAIFGSRLPPTFVQLREDLVMITRMVNGLHLLYIALSQTQWPPKCCTFASHSPIHSLIHTPTMKSTLLS